MVGTKAEIIAKLNEMYEDDDTLMLDVWCVQDVMELSTSGIEPETAIGAMYGAHSFLRNESTVATVFVAVNGSL